MSGIAELRAYAQAKELVDRARSSDDELPGSAMVDAVFRVIRVTMRKTAESTASWAECAAWVVEDERRRAAGGS